MGAHRLSHSRECEGCAHMAHIDRESQESRVRGHQQWVSEGHISCFEPWCSAALPSHRPHYRSICRSRVAARSVQLSIILAFAVIGTVCNDGGLPGTSVSREAPTGGQRKHGLLTSLREVGQGETHACTGEHCATATRAHVTGNSQAHGAQSADAPEGVRGTGKAAVSVPANDTSAQGLQPLVSPQGREPETRVVEDATEQRSLFAKFVDLVTPPSAQSAPPPPADDLESQASMAEGGRDGDMGANASEAGANATGTGAPTEAHKSERGDVNASGGGTGASRNNGDVESPIELTIGEDEPTWLSDDLLKPVDIGPDIFPELIPSIKSAYDPCAGKCNVDTCSGHGRCGGDLCLCNCTGLYTGRYCHEHTALIANLRLTPPKRPCPDNCTGQGECKNNGRCSCYKGWAGSNCSIECMGGVTNPCSGHGMCLQATGKCVCSEGYAGKNCTRRSVPQDFDIYRKMVLLSESKEKEAKDAKDKAAKDAKDKADKAAAAAEEGSGGSGGGLSGVGVGDSARKGDGDDTNVNVSVAELATSVAVANSTANLTAKLAEEAGNSTGKHKNASSADAADAEQSHEAKKTSEDAKWVKGVEVSSERLRLLGVDHAAFDLGGKVLATNKEARSESALLKSDKDKYWISPCKVEKGAMWVILELNEIIHVRTIVLGSFEYYSSTPHKFQVLGQLAYPTERWHVMGHFEASSSRKPQEFTMKKPWMAKVLKIRVLTHHGNEFYCTISSVQVFGTTQWEEMGRALEENEQQVKIVKRALDGGAAEDSEEAGEHGKQAAQPRPAADDKAPLLPSSDGNAAAIVPVLEPSNASSAKPVPPLVAPNGSATKHVASNVSIVGVTKLVPNSTKPSSHSPAAPAATVESAPLHDAGETVHDAGESVLAPVAAVDKNSGSGSGVQGAKDEDSGVAGAGAGEGESAVLAADGASASAIVHAEQNGGVEGPGYQAEGTEVVPADGSTTVEVGKKVSGLAVPAGASSGYAQKTALVGLSPRVRAEGSLQDIADMVAAQGSAAEGGSKGTLPATVTTKPDDGAGVSLFAKIVDLVTPPSAPATAAADGSSGAAIVAQGEAGGSGGSKAGEALADSNDAVQSDSSETPGSRGQMQSDSALGEDPMYAALPRILVPPKIGQWEGGGEPLREEGTNMKTASEGPVFQDRLSADQARAGQGEGGEEGSLGGPFVDASALSADVAALAMEWKGVTEMTEWGHFICPAEHRRDAVWEVDAERAVHGLLFGDEADWSEGLDTCLAFSLPRDDAGALVLPSALADKERGGAAGDEGAAAGGGTGAASGAVGDGAAAAQLGGAVIVEGGDDQSEEGKEHVPAEGGGSGERVNGEVPGEQESDVAGDVGAAAEQAREAERLKLLEEEQLKMKAEEDAQKAEGERKKEERRRMLEEQKRAVMAGMVSGPSKSGELSFFQKVPEKIKELEINLSFLQSYMEETKKGHDESFEDVSSEVHALQTGLAALKAEVSAHSADIAARFRAIEDRRQQMEAEQRAHMQRLEEQERLLGEIRALLWGGGVAKAGWNMPSVMLVLVLVLVVRWLSQTSSSSSGKSAGAVGLVGGSSSYAANRGSLDGLQGRWLGALFAVANRLRLAWPLEALLVLLGYRPAMRAHRTLSSSSVAHGRERKNSVSGLYLPARALSDVGSYNSASEEAEGGGEVRWAAGNADGIKGRRPPHLSLKTINRISDMCTQKLDSNRYARKLDYLALQTGRDSMVYELRGLDGRDHKASWEAAVDEAAGGELMRKATKKKDAVPRAQLGDAILRTRSIPLTSPAPVPAPPPTPDLSAAERVEMQRAHEMGRAVGEGMGKQALRDPLPVLNLGEQALPQARDSMLELVHSANGVHEVCKVGVIKSKGREGRDGKRPRNRSASMDDVHAVARILLKQSEQTGNRMVGVTNFVSAKEEVQREHPNGKEDRRPRSVVGGCAVMGSLEIMQPVEEHPSSTVSTIETSPSYTNTSLTSLSPTDASSITEESLLSRTQSPKVKVLVPYGDAGAS